MEVKQTLVHNPYRKVNFNTYTRHLCNLHCHTTYSDGYKEPHVRVDEYHDAGFTILAITDHDTSHKNYPRTLYPWTDFELIWDEVRDGVSKTWPTSGTGGWVTDNNNRGDGNDWENRDPEALGMLAIEATELTAALGTLPRREDLTAFDCGIPAQATTLFATATNVENAGGWSVLVHPGRSTAEFTPAYILNLKQNHMDSLMAMDVFDRRSDQPFWQNRWDEVNRNLPWDKPLYGMGSDDAHYSEQLFEGYNQVFLPELTKEAFVDAVQNGAYGFSDQWIKGNKFGPGNWLSTTAGQMENPAPFITRISRGADAIRVDALNADSYSWQDDSGNEIATGNEVSIRGLTHKFVRCLIDNATGTTATQPFGLKEENVEEDALFML